MKHKPKTATQYLASRKTNVTAKRKARRLFIVEKAHKENLNNG